MGSFSELKDWLDAQFTNAPGARMYLPGKAYTLDQGLILFGETFETNILNQLPVREIEGVPVHTVQIGESTSEPVERIWTDAQGIVWTNTAPSYAYNPTDWVLSRFSVPEYLSSTEREEWIEARKLNRQTLRLDLVAAADLATLFTALSNAVSSQPIVLESNEIGAVQFTISENGDLSLLIHAPADVDYVGVYGIHSLTDFPWSFIANLPNESDPIHFQYPAQTNQTILTIANHVADNDHDGLLDALEEMILGCRSDMEDTDEDGVDDYDEVMVHNTDPSSGDTDGDGLSDAFEIANNINPNDAGGSNGADGDLDGDGLTNLQEQALGTDPNTANTVIDAGSEGANFSIQTKSYSATHSKVGFEEMVEPSNPPKFYLKSEENLDWVWFSYFPVPEPVGFKLEYIAEYNPTTHVAYVSRDYTELRWLIDTECIDQVSSNGGYYTSSPSHPSCGTPQNTNNLVMIQEPDYCYTFLDNSVYVDGIYYYCGGPYSNSIAPNTALSVTELSKPFTTAMLENIVEEPLSNFPCGDFSAMPYDTGKHYYIEENDCQQYPSSHSSSLRLLSTNETDLTLRTIKFRCSGPTQAGIVYRLRWVETFFPDPVSNPDADVSVIDIKTILFKGLGGNTFIGDDSEPIATAQYAPFTGVNGNDFLIEPPSSSMGNGSIHIGLLNIDLLPTNILVSVENVNQTIQPSADSNWGQDYGEILSWSSIPTGLGNITITNNQFTFMPSNSVPGIYTVRAESSLSSEVFDEVEVVIIHVDIEQENEIPSPESTSETLNLTTSSYSPEGKRPANSIYPFFSLHCTVSSKFALHGAGSWRKR